MLDFNQLVYEFRGKQEAAEKRNLEREDGNSGITRSVHSTVFYPDSDLNSNKTQNV